LGAIPINNKDEIDIHKMKKRQTGERWKNAMKGEVRYKAEEEEYCSENE
jgi:hypothetical protein